MFCASQWPVNSSCVKSSDWIRIYNMHISGLRENRSTKERSGPQILQLELCGSELPAETHTFTWMQPNWAFRRGRINNNPQENSTNKTGKKQKRSKIQNPSGTSGTIFRCHWNHNERELRSFCSTCQTHWFPSQIIPIFISTASREEQSSTNVTFSNAIHQLALDYVHE